MTKQPHPQSERAARPLGAKKTKEPNRQCLATRDKAPKAGLVRFVVGPDNNIVPDIAEKLPGRGLWVSADRTVLEQAIARKLFARAARAKVSVPIDLSDQVESLLARRCLDLLGQAHGAGQVVLGANSVHKLLRDAATDAVIQASDGSRDGRSKIFASLQAGHMLWGEEDGKAEPLVAGCFSCKELSLALGRENVIHAALKDGGFAGRILSELRRMGGFRPLRPVSWGAAQGDVAPGAKASVSDA